MKESPYRTALLLIDVVNDFAFDAGQKMLAQALPAARRIRALRSAAAKARIPVIYVNDNFGLWRSEKSEIVDHCLAPRSLGRKVTSLLKPRRDDYFIIKPRHSGFYATNLQVLLPHLGVQRLVLTGFAADICVLFTANDAYMRSYELWVPADCVASESAGETKRALDHMAKNVKAEVRPTRELTLGRWLRAGRRRPLVPSTRREGRAGRKRGR
jgi:nicotinamidase-related amidase